MRKLSGILFMLTCVIAACHQPGKKTTPPVPDSLSFIPNDSANKMIGSYINSVHYTESDTNLLSISIDAQALRNYLQDTSIAHMKLILAHTLGYINSGGKNKPCGYKNDALTIILAAYQNDGKYVYRNGSTVMDHGAPCPTNCPPGAAGNPLLISSSAQK